MIGNEFTDPFAAVSIKGDHGISRFCSIDGDKVMRFFWGERDVHWLSGRWGTEYTKIRHVACSKTTLPYGSSI